MGPADVAVAETLARLENVLPPSQRVLEVGCRDGLLASQLQAIGHHVVAIDSNKEQIARAQCRGVDARHAQWPEFDAEPFDAILFTRSMHHMRSLEDAVARCASLLHGDGLVFLDEFAVDQIGPVSAEWIYQMLSVMESCSSINWRESPLPSLHDSSSSLDAWHADHYDVPTISRLREALEKHFKHLVMTPAAYLYRYLTPMLVDDQSGYRVARRLASLEKRLAETTGEPLVGRQIVCSMLR